ncbi:MAG TPA: T9SS type A sorting domain-containing protein, partial [Bacteroidales bacterium]|nr:T9SS type A sorting domain-containing protein [Bacteroidales bacterium]
IEITITGGTPPYTINWSNLQHTELITGLTSGTYYVEVIDANNCSTIDNVFLSILSGVQMGLIHNAVVFPNPVLNELIIVLPQNAEETNVKIINSIGEIVYEGVVSEKAIIKTYDFASGMYLVKFEYNNLIEIRKIIKE